MAETTAQPRNCWLRYQLWTLLLLIVAGVLVTGWRNYRLAIIRREAVAATELKKIGCSIVYRRRGPEWLVILLGEEAFFEVDELLAETPTITDAELVHLRALNQLTELRLDRASITDAGLANLRDMAKLRGLSLDHTQVSDKGLTDLYGLGGLQYVSLRGTGVSQAGVDRLEAALQNVRVAR